ncbi:hypothetical protein [Phaeobacter inhibens]|uniref:hypothetical protein n=1 Tax=Phaeobacter inhibens TaxID=221822 RepID=UPI002491A338|nr:hypothetical protein [Phaeobacter inhibens]
MPTRYEEHPFKFRTKLACEIVDIDPLRLNEAIAAKDGYKCAPETRPGVAREFGEFDLISLYLFRFLTGLGYSQSLASMYACGVLQSLQQSYHTLPERFDFPLNPFPDTAIPCVESEPTTFLHSGNLIAHTTICFNVVVLREMIRGRMEHIAARERNTFGDD